jgi:uridine phosphorylase
MDMPVLLRNKRVESPSVFQPSVLLREARRQKGILEAPVPSVCLLDPDGDLIRRLRRTGAARPFEGWPCYHTELDTFALGGIEVGIVGRVVGAPFAVLVAEELFASGCELLISLTSAGQILPAGPPPYFVVIDRALRDEGTSYHYAAVAEFADASPELATAAIKALATLEPRSLLGPSWTTDAPFRETSEAIDFARAKGIYAVEMEAAALYAFAAARRVRVLCLAHVTNTMGLAGDDFEKGEADGTSDALAVLERVVAALAGAEDLGAP